MVYMFGINIPIVEALFILGVISLISVSLTLITLYALRKLNKKLDQILKEERIVERELHQALEEENNQIEVLLDLTNSIRTMNKISVVKSKKIKEAEKMISKANKKSIKSTDSKKEMKKAIAKLKDVDELTREEDKVLKKIGKDVKKYGHVKKFSGKIVKSFKGLFSKK